MPYGPALGCRPSGDHDRGAGICNQASIRVLLQRVEVDGVAGAKSDLIDSNSHFQLPLKEIKQLDSGMEMGRDVFRRQWMKVRQKAVEFPCRSEAAERLEK